MERSPLRTLSYEPIDLTEVTCPPRVVTSKRAYIDSPSTPRRQRAVRGPQAGLGEPGKAWCCILAP